MNISQWNWIEEMIGAPAPAGLQALFDDFVRATRDELWSEREGLTKFVRTEGTIERYIDGDIGNNLLFVHKTRAITQLAPELAEFAYDTFVKVVEREGHGSGSLRDFAAEAVHFHRLRMTNLFDKWDEEIAADFNYDIAEFMASKAPRQIEDFRLAHPKRIRFVLDGTQIDVMRRFISIYGRSPVGIGRILSKIHTKKMMRHSVSGLSTVTSDGGELRYQIAGLQN